MSRPLILLLPCDCPHNEERQVRPTFTNDRNFMAFDFLYPYRTFARTLLPPHTPEGLVNRLAEQLAMVGQDQLGTSGCLYQFKKWLDTGAPKERVLVCGLVGRWARDASEELKRQFGAYALSLGDLANASTVMNAIDYYAYPQNR